MPKIKLYYPGIKYIELDINKYNYTWPPDEQKEFVDFVKLMAGDSYKSRHKPFYKNIGNKKSFDERYK